MCLYVKRRPTDHPIYYPRPAVADKPIRCLKVVRKISVMDPRPDIGVTTDYLPPIWDYCMFRYRIGETASMERVRGSALQAAVCGSVAASITGYEYEVNHGLHTYRPDVCGARLLYDALNEQIERKSKRAMPSGDRKEEAAVLECEIPAGALYYEGVSEESNCVDTRGYASDRLTVLRELTEREIKELPAPPAYDS